jgi:hypothetical protein
VLSRQLTPIHSDVVKANLSGAMLFLNLHNEGLGVVSIFWGLWLFPLGLLVFRSGFLPPGSPADG